MIVFLIIGTAEVQPWAVKSPEKPIRLKDCESGISNTIKNTFFNFKRIFLF